MRTLAAFCLLVLVWACLPCFAQADQAPTADFVLLAKAFGPVASYASEATMLNGVPLNPALQNSLYELGLKETTEADFGRLSLRSGSDVNWTILNYATRIGKRGSARVSYYGMRSTPGMLPGTAPLSASLGSKSLEFVGAYRISRGLDLGVALIPVDDGSATIWQDGTRLASGTSVSRWQARAGVLYRRGQIAVGHEFGEESGRYRATMGGMDIPSSNYAVRHNTVGVSWTPALGTTLFYNQQRWVLTSLTIQEKLVNDFWGIEQAFSRQLVMRVARLGPGTAYSLTYIGKGYSVTAAYTVRSFSTSESFFGRGDQAYLIFNLNR